MTPPKKTNGLLYLIDGSGFIFRAYHALPPLTRKEDGLPLGAVAGFCAMINKLLRGMKADVAPTHIAVVFDPPGGSFRQTLYPDYKAKRPPLPEDLIPQFALVRQATKAFGICPIEVSGYEADDVIATYTQQAQAEGVAVRIVSSDKDLMQLVTPYVTLYDPMKDIDLGEAAVLEKFGVSPSQVIDVQALAGDSSDNIPGVPGIGIKTASQLITQYGTLEALLEGAFELPPSKRREQLLSYQDQARLCLELVKLKKDVPLPFSYEAFAVSPPVASHLIGFLKALDLRQLTKRIAENLAVDPEEIEKISIDIDHWQRPTSTPLKSPNAHTPPDQSATIPPPIDTTLYETVLNWDRLTYWIDLIKKTHRVAIDTETTGLDPLRASLVGISLSTGPQKACYIPLNHTLEEGFFQSTPLQEQLEQSRVLEELRPLLEDPGILKIGHNIKYDAHIFQQLGLNVTGVDDTMLMSYVLFSGCHGHGMDELSKQYLDHTPIAFGDVVGKGKKSSTFDKVALKEATHYAAEDAEITWRLWQIFRKMLYEHHLLTVYETLERPLISILGQMEATGISVDPLKLKELSERFTAKADRLAQEIYALRGSPFTIASPKQLGDILFSEMGFAGGKKTPKGAWSTDSDVLEELASSGVLFASKILEWRHVTKLKNTYTDALLEHINPKTRRVHTSYSMVGATTGRLSSNDPNLQNIPIKTEEGREIRHAFIARPGYTLISADYSQIELRLLAHIADIPALKQAFKDGVDIHALTASEMFNLPLDQMTQETRRRAKAINFGIIYGISAFGLARQLGISKEEAGTYIKTYFERFPQIKDYMEHTKEKARTQGYVTTLFGRRVHFPKINAKNHNERAFYERSAINAPIQGSAADIIRRAMVKITKAFHLANLTTNMLLQVHDELVFEAPEHELETALPLIVAHMEKAALPVLTLDVKPEVQTKIHQRWS